MRKRIGLLASLTVVIVVAFAVAALADMANGTGKTHKGNTLGFNAKSNLTGSFEYNGAPGTRFAIYNVHCNDYLTYTPGTYTDKNLNPGTYPSVTLTTNTCSDAVTGETYFVHAVVVDEGEPGTYDFACIQIYDGQTLTLLVKDRGYIQNGNIQIHTNTDGTTEADILSTV